MGTRVEKLNLVRLKRIVLEENTVSPKVKSKDYLKAKLLIRLLFTPGSQAETRKRTWRGKLNILKTTAPPRVIKL